MKKKFKFTPACGSEAPTAHTNYSPKCDCGSANPPANLPKPSSAVRNDGQNNRKSAFTLAEGATHVDIFAKKRQVAFTLAEVLITLGVIGIVAAMTLPGLITSYQKKMTVNSLKQAYVFLHNIMARASVDYGDMNGWDVLNGADMTAEDVVSKYFEPYIKGTKINRNSEQRRKYIAHWMDGSQISFGPAPTFASPQGYYYNVVKVGTSFYYIYIDINGTKRPNIVGKDLFIVLFDVDGMRFDDRNFVGNVSRHCMIGRGNGSQCGAKIEKDGWQIKDDYPW